METSLAESQTDSYFPTKWPNGYLKQKDVSDTHIQRRTITKINHHRRTALERSVKSISLEGLNRFYVATILALTSAAVWTHNLFSPHEGFLTHQCYISENTKKPTNYRDETTMRTRQHETTEMLEKKKTNSKTPVGPTKDRASSTDQHYTKLNFK